MRDPPARMSPMTRLLDNDRSYGCGIWGCLVFTSIDVFGVPNKLGRSAGKGVLESECSCGVQIDYYSCVGLFRMGKCKGCGQIGRMGTTNGSMSSYEFSLMLSPVVSFWDCMFRKMRYSYRPEWV
ncbi:hypothetical protein glysoja_027666 [Glycine soja]|uniref:Uncharacterized protein n=2 Tax=Glycine soja TaxID=3848 RepID=A0A0B2QQ37_GLYSO|nr:hypothetical protein glysoja_027666 [Glycine soja]